MKINDYPLWTALITPLNPDDTVDYQSLEKVVREQEMAKNAILLLGSTGEALNLDLETKKEIVNFVTSLEISVPLMLGVGGIHLPTTKAWLSFLEEKSNIDAYLMVSPLYAKPGTNGQYLWFKDLMDQSTRPVMLYNIPGRTGSALCPLAVKKLLGHPRLWAIKEASGSVCDFSNYQKVTEGAVRIYSGDDPMLPDYVPHGCVGLVSVASNAWPEQTNKYVELALKNELYNKLVWEESSNALFVASNPIPVKVLMHKLNRIAHNKLALPLTAQDCETQEQLNQLMKANENIIAWFEQL